MDLDVRRRARGQQEPGIPRTPTATSQSRPHWWATHAAGLVVHIWTIRDENQFLPKDFWIGTDPNAKGDSISEIHAFLDAGVDGVLQTNRTPPCSRATPGSRSRRSARADVVHVGQIVIRPAAGAKAATRPPPRGP